MIYKEIKGNLFKAPKDFHFAHCISSDLKMGAGIAVPMNKKFKLRQQFNLYTLPDSSFKQYLKHPMCIKTSKVFNLITKERYFYKPTYGSLYKSLEIMKQIIIDKGIYKIAMPKIGCGLDKLQWVHIQKMIKEIFHEIDIEIRVYYQ